MQWSVEFTDIAEKTFNKLDEETKARVLKFFRQRVAASDDPRVLAKALHGERAGLWRFRIGDYRAICDIQRSNLVVLVLAVAHRKEIYR